jgi:acetoin utilization deacetylase AcuC-like enzyme
MNTAFLSDDRFLLHDTGPSHPERAARVSVVLDQLEKQPWFEKLLPLRAISCDEAWLCSVHDVELVQRAKKACLDGYSYLDSPDVQVSQQSFDTALLATGGILRLVDTVVSGQANNGFALVRPPGHHAEKNTALGFCLFNNVAIAARYLQQRHGLDKILILDWDVHHGNGTQHLFEDDPSVYYISLHQYPHYPGTGAASETGFGRGAGATLNCPMAAGSGDDEYQQAFKQKILPGISEFRPEAVLVSAGFDAHQADPLGAVNLSTSCYGWMTERMLEIADQHSDGRLISMLEGGYNLNALADSVAEHLLALLGNSNHPNRTQSAISTVTPS